MMDAVVAYHDGNGQGGGRGGGPMVVDGSQPGEAVRNGQGPGAQFLRRCDAAPAEDPRPEPDGASMAALVAFELEMAGAGPCRGCRLLLADSALTTLCLLWPWVAGDPGPGRASALGSPEVRRHSALQNSLPGRLPPACLEVTARPLGFARVLPPHGGPGPGPPSDQLSQARMRQKNMHLSPDTKKRKGAAHGYANMLAARSNPTSLATALLGPEAVAVGFHCSCSG